MKRLIFSRAAREDFLSIVEYLLENNSAKTALQVIDDIESGLDRVGKNPDLGHQRLDLGSDLLRFWLVSRYMIIYRQTDEYIQIVRLIHSARDIASILDS